MEKIQIEELKSFIKENSYLIYEFINCEVLKEVGELNPNYFIKIISDSFLKDEFHICDTNPSKFPYTILTLLEGKGKMDYTSFRKDTLFLNKLNAKASVYYNYAKFSVDNEFLYIDFMQMKIGGMPIDKDILKFREKILINETAFEEFLLEDKNSTLNEIDLKIKNEIDKIL